MICGLDSMQQDKSRLYVEKGTPTHAFELAEKLRESDIFECALGGNTPMQSLISPFRYRRDNVNTYTILKNKEVIAMFGVVSAQNNLKNGTVWFLASDKIYDNWKYFTKRTKKWTDYFLSDYDFVYNFVPENNTTTIKWLKWLGFSFSNKEIVVRGTKVLYFYKYIQGVYKDIQPIIGDIGPQWTTDIS